MAARQILGIDAGGTFTDFVFYREGEAGPEVIVHKVLSTPEAPEQAILQGLAEMGLTDLARSGGLQIIHGSTVATNAALEGNGVTTAFITNRGFGDLLALGRQTRPSLYSLEFPPVAPPVGADYCIETGGRLGADGAEIEALLPGDIALVLDRIRVLAPRAVAINLLFSFLDGRHERALQEAIEAALPGLFVCRSSEVLPEYREYERGVATWLNASLGPIVSGYIASLGDQLGDCPLLIMQSSGETLSAKTAARRAVNLLLSGPAGGLAALGYLGSQTGQSRFISFDMGGTSTDVALLDGEARITNEGRIANYPVAVPMVDMHTIGAGGGSIAFLDGGGMLRVGPRSAGADPGPACYGRGGRHPTVTDANVVLGRIPETVALAGSFPVDRDAALSVIAPLAAAAGMTSDEMALGIVRVANENMASALRMISVQRGYDPAEFTLASFGGAGGLHVCALAEAMGMDRAIVPVDAGVLSALGMLVAPRGRQYSRTVRVPVRDAGRDALEATLEELAERGTHDLMAEGLPRASLRMERSADLCYLGQSSTLNLPWENDSSAMVAAFHGLHLERYGFELDRAIEVVNLRVRLVSDQATPQLTEAVRVTAGNKSRGDVVYDVASRFPVFARSGLRKGETVQGPAIVTELSATTFIDHDWSGALDRIGNLTLVRTRKAPAR